MFCSGSHGVVGKEVSNMNRRTRMTAVHLQNSQYASNAIKDLPSALIFQLFHVWSRMAAYKKAVRQEKEPPTFLPEDGYKQLPEWDTWVVNKGRHLAMKRTVMHIGGQVGATLIVPNRTVLP